MTAQMVLTIGSDALTLLLMIAMPVLGVVMAVGLLVIGFGSQYVDPANWSPFIPEPTGKPGQDGGGGNAAALLMPRLQLAVGS